VAATWCTAVKDARRVARSLTWLATIPPLQVLARRNGGPSDDREHEPDGGPGLAHHRAFDPQAAPLPVRLDVVDAKAADLTSPKPAEP
jgi:hypothetical protein